jgi:hypothetical protein
MIDYIELDDQFSIARTNSPKMSGTRPSPNPCPAPNTGLTIVGVKRVGENFTYARPDTPAHRHHQLIVSGPPTRSRLVHGECYPVSTTRTPFGRGVPSPIALSSHTPITPASSVG